MNQLLHSEQISSPIRIEARKSKLRDLTPEQSKSLRQWLTEDKVTYAVARVRLLEKFGISLSTWAISHFWHRHCTPVSLTPASDILLDVVIQSASPVRLTVKRKNSGINLSCKPDA